MTKKIHVLKDWIIPPKIWCLILDFYYDYKFRFSYENNRTLLLNANFKDKYKGKRCFILGNGPSINGVDLSKLENEITIVMNYFHHNPVLEKWQPTIYCAGDPVSSYNNRELELMREVPQKIFPKEAYFLPLSVKNLFEKNHIFPSEKTRYLDMHGHVLHWNLKNSDFNLTKKIPAVQNTIVMAIILAMYFGCEKIYLIGADHNWLAYPKISLTPHFYQNPEKTFEEDITSYWKYKHNIEAVLTMFKQYEKIHKYAQKRNIEIINLTEGSFLDEFPRAKYEDIILKKIIKNF
jgi:hypothetical protein